jgi:hypothetical protein
MYKYYIYTVYYILSPNPNRFAHMYIYISCKGSTGSVGVGSRSVMLKVAGSSHLCVLRDPVSSCKCGIICFPGGGGDEPFKAERKFPTSFWNM